MKFHQKKSSKKINDLEGYFPRQMPK